MIQHYQINYKILVMSRLLKNSIPFLSCFWGYLIIINIYKSYDWVGLHSSDHKLSFPFFCSVQPLTCIFVLNCFWSFFLCLISGDSFWVWEEFENIYWVIWLICTEPLFDHIFFHLGREGSPISNYLHAIDTHPKSSSLLNVSNHVSFLLP